MQTTATLNNRKPRKKLLSNEVFGMLIFTFTEAMFFTGLLSACIVIKGSNRFSWVPPETVKLPLAVTGFNTFLLLLSGIFVVLACMNITKSKSRSLTLLISGTVLGGFFVGFQGKEWVDLLSYGMSMESNLFSACFFLLIGTHGLHALGGIIGLLACLKNLKRDHFRPEVLYAASIFWLLVVLVWPAIYIFMYL